MKRRGKREAEKRRGRKGCKGEITGMKRKKDEGKEGQRKRRVK